jgi:hypothetical protein
LTTGVSKRGWARQKLHFIYMTCGKTETADPTGIPQF